MEEFQAQDLLAAAPVAAQIAFEVQAGKQYVNNTVTNGGRAHYGDNLYHGGSHVHHHGEDVFRKIPDIMLILNSTK